jgi:hypothetical protein
VKIGAGCFPVKWVLKKVGLENFVIPSGVNPRAHPSYFILLNSFLQWPRSDSEIGDKRVHKPSGVINWIKA